MQLCQAAFLRQPAVSKAAVNKRQFPQFLRYWNHQANFQRTIVAINFHIKQLKILYQKPEFSVTTFYLLWHNICVQDSFSRTWINYCHLLNFVCIIKLSLSFACSFPVSWPVSKLLIWTISTIIIAFSHVKFLSFGAAGEEWSPNLRVRSSVLWSNWATAAGTVS